MIVDLKNIPAEVWLWVAAVTVPLALLLGHRLFVIDRRERIQRQRLENFRGAVRIDPQAPRPVSWLARIGELLAPIVGVVEQQRLQKLLAAAGITTRGSVSKFIAMKAILAITFVVVAWSMHLLTGVMLIRVALLGVAFLIGWRLPDLGLNRLVARRRLRLEQGIPDALDLLVICAEAGLSLNQAIEEVSRQLRMSNKDVADEFSTTSAEMRVLPDFGHALDNLIERTGLNSLRSLIATLKQSIEFGTPLAESLRMIAAEMRAERHARIEERAGRLPVLLAIPMMMFILPCLFMIIGTPVVIRIMDVFKNVTFGAP